MNWFNKNSLKNQLLYLFDSAKVLGLNAVDINNAKEYLLHGEYGRCFHVLTTQMYLYHIEIDLQVYVLIKKIGEKMKLPISDYAFIEELVRDNPQKPTPAIKFPFHKEVLSGEIENVKAALSSNTNLDELDELGNSPLHWAVMRGDFDMVELLLNTGANPNVMCSDGYTPKWSAADFGLTEIQQLLTLFGGKIATNKDFDNTSWSVFKDFLNEPMPGEES